MERLERWGGRRGGGDGVDDEDVGSEFEEEFGGVEEEREFSNVL